MLLHYEAFGASFLYDKTDSPSFSISIMLCSIQVVINEAYEL